MAITEQGIAQAEITFCMEKIKNNNGYRDLEDRDSVRQLPWCFVRFNDPGEERKYVMPLPPGAMILGSGIHGQGMLDVQMPVEGGVPIHYEYGRAFLEWMPFLPFPLDNGAGARSSGDAAGTVAVHFFGG